jgi:pimeloyl-ACP methyl ester carboxylesterase
LVRRFRRTFFALSVLADAFARLAIPNARILILLGVSHFALLQDPDQINQALITFLTG